MNKKKWLVLLFIVLIASPFLAHTVYAAEQTAPLKQVLTLFVDNFGFLLEEKTRTEMLSGAGTGLLYLRIMLGLLILLPLYALLKVPFKSQRGIAGAISVVVSLMAVILMPISTMIKIGTTYSGFFVIIFYLVPLIALFFLHRFIKSSVGNESVINVAEIVIGVVGILFTSQVQATLTQLTQEYSALGKTMDIGWFAMIYVVLGIMIVWAFVRLIKGKDIQGIKGALSEPLWGGKGKGSSGGWKGGSLPTESKDAVDTVTVTEKNVTDIKNSIDRSTADAKAIISTISAASASEQNLIEKTKTNLTALGNAVSSLGKALEEQANYAKAGATAESVAEVGKAISDNGTQIKTKYGEIGPDLENIKKIHDTEYQEVSVLLNEFVNSSDAGRKIELLLNENQAVNVSVKKVSAKNKSVLAQLNNILSNPSVDENFKNSSVRNDLMALQNFETRLETDLADISVHNNVCQKIKNDMNVLTSKSTDIENVLTKFNPQIDGFKKDLQDKLVTPFGGGLSPQVISEAENAIQKIIKDLEDMQSKSTVVTGNLTIIKERVDEMKNLETDLDNYLRELEDIKLHINEMNKKYIDIANWYKGQQIGIAL